MNKKRINLEELETKQKYGLLTNAVGPRPIGFASTMDKEGNINLSPFSFFNVFGINPPVLIISPTKGSRNNKQKDTYNNIKEVAEVSINVVNHDMVEQMALSSSPYDSHVNEFQKAGFTESPSSSIKPPNVLESPVSFECKVTDVIETGDKGGSGNLIICEVKVMHVDEEYLDADGKLDGSKLDLVARMGGNYYCRAFGDALFELEKSLAEKGIGVDSLPDKIKNSKILTGNNLGRLGNLRSYPSELEIESFSHTEFFESIKDHDDPETAIHNAAKILIENGDVTKALIMLLAGNK